MMNNRLRFLPIGITMALGLVACNRQEAPEAPARMVPAADVTESKMDKMIAKFVPTDISYDEGLLTEREQKVVAELYAASKIMDELFLQQAYAGNEELREELTKDSSPEAAKTRQYFDIMFGPFDRLDHSKPFMGTKTRPAGANFYPEDMSKEEFAAWLTEHPEDKAAFTSEFTVIRRSEGKLVAIPYSEFYGDKLKIAAEHLRKGAESADNPSLKKYLLSRADAFGTDDYFQSDVDWMDLKDHTIEVVIGPYEVYEDELFNYKASFEGFITVRDPKESAKLAKFVAYLDDIERNLPIPDEYKNFERGSESPMVVVQEIYAAGDAKSGVQTLAFNLPNDEKVREAKGSKKVMLKNLHEAKFEKLLKPIAAIVLEPEQLKWVTFDGFFNHTLMHEISHGVGPGKIIIDGRKTEVKQELKETYSKLEECKADVLGMYNNVFMIEKGVFPKTFEKDIAVTFLAGIFRSIRFGITEAHGAGNAIIFNYLLERGAYELNAETAKVKVNFERIQPVVKELATRLLTIQANGDYAGAKKMLEQYGTATAAIETLRSKLAELPVDIKPVFQIDKMLGTSEM